MLIVRHLGTPNSDFNGCQCMRDPVLYRSMSYEQLKTYFQASSQEICASFIIFHILKGRGFIQDTLKVEIGI